MKSFITILIVVVLNDCGAYPAVTDSTEEIFLANEQTPNKNQPVKSEIPFIDVLERKSAALNKTENPPFVADEPIEDTIIEDMSKEDTKTIEDSDSSNSEISKRSIIEQNRTKIEENFGEFSKESEEIVEEDDNTAKLAPEVNVNKYYETNLEVPTKEQVDSGLEENLDRDALLPERRMMEGVEEIVDRAGEFVDNNPRRLITNPGTVMTRFQNNYEPTFPTFLKTNRIERHFLVADPKINYARTTTFII